MDLVKRIREARKNLKLSQVGLSHLANVSLPTIQNIEAGKGNPSLSVLNSLLSALALELDLKPRGADWDAFAHCGAPLTGNLSSPFDATADILLKHIRDACVELSVDSEGAIRGRKIEALQAVLLALRIYFPSFFAKHLEESPLVQRFVSAPVSSKVIKLKRLATERLSEYL